MFHQEFRVFRVVQLLLVVQNNQQVQIACQTAGQLETNTKGVSSYVWDKLLQGGYVSDLYIDTHGIQIAPATARLAAALVRREPLPEDLVELGFDTAWVAPDRLAN